MSRILRQSTEHNLPRIAAWTELTGAPIKRSKASGCGKPDHVQVVGDVQHFPIRKPASQPPPPPPFRFVLEPSSALAAVHAKAMADPDVSIHMF